MAKPDTLPLGATKSRDLWLDVVEGRRFPLHHGYYCTRQPDDHERAKGITGAQARAAEQEFFAKTAPWFDSSHLHRFGIGNLVANLSRLLTQIIDDTYVCPLSFSFYLLTEKGLELRLPKLQNEVTRQLSACDDGQSKLPPAITTDPSSYILTLITEFCDEVKLHVKGGDMRASSLPVIQLNHRTYAAYKHDVRCTAPIFLPFSNAENSGYDTKQYSRLDEEDELVASICSGRILNLDDVRERIRQSRARELPNNVPYVAKVALIEDFQSSWEMDSRKCLSSIVLALEKTLYQLVGKLFQRYDMLRGSIIHAAMDVLRSKQDETWITVQMILDVEKTMLFTQDSHYLQVTKHKYLALYKAGRADARKPDVLQSEQMRTTKDEAEVINELIRLYGQRLLRPPEITSLPAALDDDSLDAVANHQPTSSTSSLSGEAALPGDGRDSRESARPTFGSLCSGSSGALDKRGRRKRRKKSALMSRAAPALVKPNTTSSLVSEKSTFSRPSAVLPTSALTTRSPSQPSVLTPLASTSVLDQSAAPMLDIMQEDDESREVLQNTALSALAALGFHVTATDLGKLHPPDIYEEELEVMAEVRAYFQVAYKLSKIDEHFWGGQRIIDYVPMSIDNVLLSAFAESLQACLIEKLGLGSPNCATRCAMYLSEDPSVVAKRDELKSRKARLSTVQNELFNFGL
ncbi:hypothetical protein PHLCEN_2v9906 [Hermanssonia centrifuga]|uniref:GED domain-containing protein n=1 Tax=Hermanssonia centrifuga TaxID=98765 RepID=A0A2R6NPI8_9APHY|nr:hypothetical protein PHLCEN_2v9906 [Hermanssonia centrifuga]